jgi:hypothetical protein
MGVRNIFFVTIDTAIFHSIVILLIACCFSYIHTYHSILIIAFYCSQNDRF